MFCYDHKHKSRFRADASWERLKVARIEVSFLAQTAVSFITFFFFDRCVVQIISFSGGIALMGKAMYQSAFWVSKIA